VNPAIDKGIEITNGRVSAPDYISLGKRRIYYNQQFTLGLGLDWKKHYEIFSTLYISRPYYVGESYLHYGNSTLMGAQYSAINISGIEFSFTFRYHFGLSMQKNVTQNYY